jgi:hypothetical protein
MMFPPPTLEQHVWNSVYDGLVRLVFVGAALLLGLGGLRGERLIGCESFTLALPVTRLELAAVRALTGVLQVIALAAIPLALLPPLTARYQSHGYPLEQAWWFFLLFSACGVAWFAVAFLWSVIFTGEYASAAASLVTPPAVAALALLAGPSMRWLNLLNLMSGATLPYLDARARLLILPEPWLTGAAVAGLALALLAAAVHTAARDDT